MYTLHIHPFRIWAHLGCEQGERIAVQPLDISVDLNFPGMPQACVTDDLSHTIDYSVFIASACQVAKSMEFKLIEFLAYTLHKEFGKIVSGRAQITVKVHKLHPPVEKMTNGVTFVFTGS